MASHRRYLQHGRAWRHQVVTVARRPGRPVVTRSIPSAGTGYVPSAFAHPAGRFWNDVLSFRTVFCDIESREICKHPRLGNVNGSRPRLFCLGKR